MPNGKALVVDIVFDWNPSKLADRRTPTEVLAETARRLRSELHYADHRIVLHNDAAFGGALGADLCAAVGVEAVNSTSRSSVHRLLQLLAPRLKRNQYFIFSEPRGAHSLTYIVRKVCDHFEKIQKVDGKNKLVKVKEERILVNTSTHALAPEQRANPLAADQLSDTDLRPLLTLPRTTLVGLARVIVQKSGMTLDSDEAPSANWAAPRLVAWISGRPLDYVEALSPSPALKKSARRKSKLEDELELALQPIEKELAKIAEEKEETRLCAVPLCEAKYGLTAAAPPGWSWCDACYRKALCPQHAGQWQERFVAMHCDSCDIKPTWQELIEVENEWKEKKNDVMREHDRRRNEDATVYERSLLAAPRQVVEKQALDKGLLAAKNSKDKQEIVDMLLRLRSVEDTPLDTLVLDHFGQVHWTTRDGLPELWKQYHTGFNYVDLFNKEFYKLAWKYRSMSADSTFTWDLCLIVHIQAHRFFQDCKISAHDPVKLVPFTKTLVDEFFAVFDE